MQQLNINDLSSYDLSFYQDKNDLMSSRPNLNFHIVNVCFVCMLGMALLCTWVCSRANN